MPGNSGNDLRYNKCSVYRAQYNAENSVKARSHTVRRRTTLSVVVRRRTTTDDDAVIEHVV